MDVETVVRKTITTHPITAIYTVMPGTSFPKHCRITLVWILSRQFYAQHADIVENKEKKQSPFYHIYDLITSVLW